MVIAELDQDFFDLKEMAEYPRYMVRNKADPSAYWSKDQGWVDYTNGDVFLHTDVNHLEIPHEGQWEKIEENKAEIIKPAVELRQALPETFRALVTYRLGEKGLLVEQEWRPRGMRLGKAFFDGSVLTVRALYGVDESAALLEAEAQKLAIEICDLISALIPEAATGSTHVFSRNPVLDAQTGRWQFDTCLVGVPERLLEGVDLLYQEPLRKERLPGQKDRGMAEALSILEMSEDDFDFKEISTPSRGKHVREASEVHDLGSPWDKEQRIRRAFAEAGLHIAQIIEAPADPGWGELGHPKRIIDTMLQPTADQPWTRDPLATDPLIDFLRRMTSQLGEILETTEIARVIRWNNEVGAWEITWHIGDPDITQERVIKEEEEENEQAAWKEVVSRSITKEAVEDVMALEGITGILWVSRYLPDSRPQNYFAFQGKWIPNAHWRQVNELSEKIKEKLRGLGAEESYVHYNAEHSEILVLVPREYFEEAISQEMEVALRLTEAGASVLSVEETERGVEIKGEWHPGKPVEALAEAAGVSLEATAYKDDDGGFVSVVNPNVLQEHSQPGDDDRVGIVGVFREQDDGYEVLVARREVDPEAGKWCIPGGHAHVGEEIEDGARREMKEETHLDLGRLTFVKKMRNQERNAYVWVYGCMLPKGERPKAGDDAEKIKWVPLDDMPEMAFDNNDLIQEIAEKMGIKFNEPVLNDVQGEDLKESVEFPEEEIEALAEQWFEKNGQMLMSDDSRWELALSFYIDQAGALRHTELARGEEAVVEIPSVPEGCDDVGSLHTHVGSTGEFSDFDLEQGQQMADRLGHPYYMFVVGPDENGEGLTMSRELFEPFESEASPEEAPGLEEAKAEGDYGRPGLLIVFEGIDGAGKTTQVMRLCDWLNDKGYSYIYSKWANSKQLHKGIWKSKCKRRLNPMSFSLVHASDMHLRYDNDIVPALEKGKAVICDRYYYTSYVRDRIRDVPEELLNIVYKDFREPDIIFFCHVPVRLAVERLMKDRGVGFYSSGRDVGYKTKGVERTTERYEQDMQDRYETLFKGNPKVIRLEMDRPIKDIAKEVKKHMRNKLGIQEALDADPDEFDPHELMRLSVTPENVVGALSKDRNYSYRNTETFGADWTSINGKWLPNRDQNTVAAHFTRLLSTELGVSKKDLSLGYNPKDGQLMVMIRSSALEGLK